MLIILIAPLNGKTQGLKVHLIHLCQKVGKCELQVKLKRFYEIFNIFLEQGIPFFIDHNNKTTTYNHPRTGKPVGPFGCPGLHMAVDKTFKFKIAQFRYLCLVGLKIL